MGTSTHGRLRTGAGWVLVAVAVRVAGGAAATVAAAEPLRPTADLRELFLSDPRSGSAWHASGSWSWDAAGTALVSAGPGTASLVWTGASHFGGTVAVRLKLIAGRNGAPPAARVIFSLDPATGGHRWLELAAGSPGRVTLGQTGPLRGSAEGTIQTWRAAVPAGAWQQVGVRIAGTKGVTVTLGAKTLFTAAAAPLTPGLVGVSTAASAVAFDEFSFTADPDAEPCIECHAGRSDLPLAANVYTYWNGRWWDTYRGGIPTTQQGGHGDPGGQPALGCTGARGCHDLRLPEPRDHRNGVREGRAQRPAQRSVNAYHLRPGFVVAEPRTPWEAQVTFDGYCYTACHQAGVIRDMRHEGDTTPADADYRSVRLGTHLTAADGESRNVFVDSDLTSRATRTEPDFVPCVACHDPHGTGTPAPVNNMMLRNPELDPYWCGSPNGCHI